MIPTLDLRDLVGSPTSATCLLELQERVIVCAMAHGNVLRVESTSRGPICYMRLSGIVDESFDPNALLAKVTGPKVILNLKSINRLTSFGVREWTSAMRELSKKAERVFFVECSPSVVTQLNMVANFSGTAQVLSVQAPFHCESCGWDTDVTYFIRGAETVKLPPTSCQKCNSPMSFDDDVESYFSFLFQTTFHRAPVDPSIEGLVRHFSQEGSSEAPRVRPGEGAEATVVRPPGPSQSQSLARTSMVLDPMSAGEPVGAGGLLERLRLSVVARSMLFGIGIAAAIVAALFLVLSLFEGGSSTDSENEGNTYASLVEKGRFALASVQLARMEQQSSISPEVAARFRESLVKTAIGSYEERLGMDRFAEAEAIAGELERESTLPADSRARFNHEIAVAREKKSSELSVLILEHYSQKAYDKVVQVAKRAAMVAPLNADVTFAVAESHRSLGDTDAAAGYYANFIEMAGSDGSSDDRLDDALLWRASQLAKVGRKREAEDLVRRLLALDRSDLKGPASLLLEVIVSEPARSPTPGPR